jgi:hypothetical protein
MLRMNERATRLAYSRSLYFSFPLEIREADSEGVQRLRPESREK